MRDPIETLVDVVYLEVLLLAGEISQFMTEFERGEDGIDRRQADVTLTSQTTVGVQA